MSFRTIVAGCPRWVYWQFGSMGVVRVGFFCMQVNGTWSQQHGAFLLRWEDLPVFLDRSWAPDAGAFARSAWLPVSRSIKERAGVPAGP